MTVEESSKNIVINVEKLISLNITPNSYVLAEIIQSKDKELYEYFKLKLREDTLVYYLFELYRNDILKNNPEVGFNYLFDFDKLELSDVFNKDFVKNKIQIDETDNEFYDTFYNVFPKGIINGGGLYVKSNKADVDKKLEKFIKENKTISKNTILAAAKNYVDKYKRSGDYTYMKICSYFIKKDNMSLLLSECENVGNTTSVNSRESNSNMESI